MYESPYNSNEPAFLLSRSLDEKLSADEQARIDRALGESERLRQEAEQLRALNRLIQAWAAEPVELDWRHHAALIGAQAERDADGAAQRKLDTLLIRWAGRDVRPDAERFTAAVMARVPGGHRRRIRRRFTFRVGVPLAAAAAIVIGVIGRVWLMPLRSPVCHVAYDSPFSDRPVSSELQAGARGERDETPVAVVAFLRARVAGGEGGGGSGGVSLGAVGSGPRVRLFSESPPL